MAIVKVTPQSVAQALRETDWGAIDAKTDAEIERAVAEDPDAAPIADGPEVYASRVRFVRRATGLSQPDFSARYGIPLGTLQDWEQGRAEPDASSRAYLRVIAHDPEGVAKALAAAPGRAA